MKGNDTSMDNENKWEYDYSSLYNSSGSGNGGSGYANVGSSGSNTANQYEAGGGAQPPRSPEMHPVQDPGEMPKKRRRRIRAGSILRSVLALVLAAAVGFAGGYVGSMVGDHNKLVIQASDRTEQLTNALASSTSTGGDDLTTAQVAALVTPSVVPITTEAVVYSNWSWFGQRQIESGAGSGVIISDDGYILTCAHVVDGASNIIVTVGDTDYTATVVGSDTASDVAVLKIDATGLTPAVVGDSNALAVGEEVVAVGNPLGNLSGTVTNGIVSALNRDVSIENNNGSILNLSLIQTSASISPGNSGGGLFNMAGELIGIVNAKSDASGAEGLGFAIPINDAIDVAQDLLENGYVSGRPYLGITYVAVTDEATAQQLGVSTYGIYIVEVSAGSGAAAAGLEPGDRIVSIDGAEIASRDDVSAVIDQHAAGDTISITIARDGQMMTVEATLGEQVPNN